MFRHTAGDLRQLKEGVHQFLHIPGLLGKPVQLLPACGGQGLGPQQLAVPQNGGQGRAEVVGYVGDQVHPEPLAGDGTGQGFRMFLPNSQQLSFLVRKQAFLRRYRLIFGQKLQGFFKMPPVPGVPAIKHQPQQKQHRRRKQGPEIPPQEQRSH